MGRRIQFIAVREGRSGARLQATLPLSLFVALAVYSDIFSPYGPFRSDEDTLGVCLFTISAMFSLSLSYLYVCIRVVTLNTLDLFLFIDLCFAFAILSLNFLVLMHFI